MNIKKKNWINTCQQCFHCWCIYAFSNRVCICWVIRWRLLPSSVLECTHLSSLFCPWNKTKHKIFTALTFNLFFLQAFLFTLFTGKLFIIIRVSNGFTSLNKPINPSLVNPLWAAPALTKNPYSHGSDPWPLNCSLHWYHFLVLSCLCLSSLVSLFLDSFLDSWLLKIEVP